MSYMHIENLYRPEAQKILLFRECYAMEKVHGTSARVGWANNAISFSSGGVKHESFCAVFDADSLEKRFLALGHDDVKVFGEAYGGKIQGMSATYGDTLRFVAFEVQVGETWLNVPNAADVAQKLALPFVPYRKITTDLPSIDEALNTPSEQAVRNGITEERMREGIVLRPLEEFVDSRGARVIAKHKHAEFSERQTQPPVDEAKRKVMDDANQIAQEWVTDMRLAHVLDGLGPVSIEDTKRVIDGMTEDVMREASGEIADTREVRKAIGTATAKLFKRKVMEVVLP